METPFGKHHGTTVCVYELLGTATLMFSVVMCGGNALYVVLTLWAILMIGGGITGGHYNPAVSTGVFIWRRQYAEDFRLYISMMVSQFIGAALGCLFGYLMLGNFSADWNSRHPYGAVPDAWVPFFLPEDPMNIPHHATSGRAWSAFVI